MVYPIVAILIIVVYQSQDRSPGILDKITVFLDQLLIQIRSGEILTGLNPKGYPLEPLGELACSINYCFKRGISIAPGLGLIKQNLLIAKKLAKQKRRLWLLTLARFGFVIVIAAICRFFCLDDWQKFLFASSLDRVACFLAAAICCLSLYLYLRILPVPWLGKKTPQRSSWLSSILTLKSAKNQLFDHEFQKLDKIECLKGVSLKTEKISLLTQWSDEQHRKDEDRLKVCEDLLVLFELVGAGGSAFLLLIFPLMDVTFGF